MKCKGFISFFCLELQFVLFGYFVINGCALNNACWLKPLEAALTKWSDYVFYAAVLFLCVSVQILTSVVES